MYAFNNNVTESALQTWSIIRYYSLVKGSAIISEWCYISTHAGIGVILAHMTVLVFH